MHVSAVPKKEKKKKKKEKNMHMLQGNETNHNRIMMSEIATISNLWNCICYLTLWAKAP